MTLVVQHMMSDAHIHFYKILQFLQDLISIHNAENWLGMDDDLGGPMSTSNVQPSTASPPQNKALGLAGNSNLEKTIQANLSNKLRSDTPDSAIVTDFNHHRMRSVDSPSSSSPTSTASNASINGDHGTFRYSSGQLSKCS